MGKGKEGVLRVRLRWYEATDDSKLTNKLGLILRLKPRFHHIKRSHYKR